MTTPEQNLWKGVITQALRDAFSNDPLPQRRAWSWFFHHSNDYRWVCSMAGVVPERLRRRLIEKVFLRHLRQKGEQSMETPPSLKQIQGFQQMRQAHAIFRSLYTQQDLDKAIGKLTLQDILNICKQSKIEE